MTKAISQGRELPIKSIVIYVINVILIMALVFMLVSSIAISKDVFSVLNLELKNYNVWRILHILSAVMMLVCVCLHILLHYNMFKSLIKKNVQKESYQKKARVISSVLAVLMICGVLKSSFHNINLMVNDVGQNTAQTNHVDNSRNEDETNYVDNSQNEDETQYVDGSQKEDETQYVDESQDEDETQSLEDYLGGMYCNACGRHCSLLSPQCGKGERQAESAQEAYYSTYGD